MFRKIAGAWLSFFLPGFHPWNEDDRALAAPLTRRALQATRRPSRRARSGPARPRLGGDRVRPASLGRQRLVVARQLEPEQPRRRFRRRARS